ncbi:hypothetical protein OAP58_02415 [Candidatus Pelagibacter sp.]|nr:hypothetical protein [Candidatus Pelagibacter sp.]
MNNINDKDILNYIKKALNISSKKKISINTEINSIDELDSYGWLVVIEYLHKKKVYLNINKIENVRKIKDLKKIIKRNP